MNDTPRMVALVLAAGSGTRAGGAVPKQYAPVAGKPLLRHSIEALLAHPAIHEVRVVIHSDHRALYDAAIAGLNLPEPVMGGAERADSVRAGLAAITADYVLVHDAARPFLSASIIDRIIAALTPDTGVVPALAVVDTVRRLSHDLWQEIPRDGLLRIQTPQAFPHAKLTAAMLASSQPTDEAAAWLAAGHRLAYIEGEARLAKITTRADLETAMQPATRIATGLGFDVHELFPAGEKHRIRLGGIDIPHDHKLHGHSDADVVIHAIVDALLGAISMGDIGSHFPPSDARWKGADSHIFLAEALRLVAEHGGRIQHVDVTIICESPKIGPHRDEMRAHLAKLMNLPLAYISIKATTTERLGFLGRGEGIATQALATVQLPEIAA